MIQEEIQLLLQDLCARVPYHPKGHVVNSFSGTQCDEWLTCATFPMFTDVINNCRLYLRPMSSMTTEERQFLLKFGTVGMDENDKVFDVYPYGMERTMSVIDFLNACHFDYRGLIEKGLALEAPKGMYDKRL